MFGWFKKKKQNFVRVTDPQVIRMTEDGLPVWGLSIIDKDGEVKSTTEYSSREEAANAVQGIINSRFE